MTLPHVAAGQVAEAAKQNQLIDTVNGNSTALEDATTTLESHEGRLSDMESRPSGGSHAGIYSGSWIDNDDKGGQIITGATGVKLTPWTVEPERATGCGMSNGTVTVQQAGLWYVVATTQYQGSTSVRALWLSASSAASGSGLAKYGSIAGPSMDVQTAAAVFRLPVGGVVSAYAAIWSGSNMNIYRNASNSITVAWLGP